MSPGETPTGPEGASGGRLRCGADVDHLLDQVAAGRGGEFDSHQVGCPHCRAALGEYDRLWAPVRELADSEVRAPESLLEDTIRRLRNATSDPDYGTLPSPTGTTRISARVVVVTARETAQDIAGVRVALSKLITAGVTPTAEPEPSPPEEPRVEAGMAGRSTALEVVLAADYGTDLVALGERIRTEVAARVRDLTGLEPVSVSVRIDDVFH